MNKFNFFVDLSISDDILKSATESKENRYKNMIIEGLASDDSEDTDKEILEPKGFQINDFLKSGYINLEHFTVRKGDPQYWIGEPLDARIEGNNFFVKAKLWEHHPLARNFWDTLLIMKASGSNRKPGFSIEGSALERHPLNKKRVTKARINHCAVTFAPKNKNSFFDIVKGEQESDFVEVKHDSTESPKYIYEFENEGKKYGITKELEIEENGVFNVLKKESLDPKVKNVLVKALLNKKITAEKVYNFLKKR